MNCKKCGAPIPGSTITCPYCGNPVETVALSAASDEATDFAEKDENDYSTTPEAQTEFAGDAFLSEDVPAAPVYRYEPPHEVIPQRAAAPQPKRKPKPKAPIGKQTLLRIVLLVVLAILILLLIFRQLFA